MRLSLMTMIHSPTIQTSCEWHEAQSRLNALALPASTTAMQRWRLPQKEHVASAVDGWMRAARIGRAYVQSFPREWAASKAATRITGAVMCARESEFFGVVAARLPTVGRSNYFWGASNRPTQLTLRTCGYELHSPDEFEQCDPVVLALEYLAASDSLHADKQWLYLRGRLPCALPKLHETCAWLDCRTLRQRAVQRGMRQFAHLADAFEVINGLTGNRFLDSDHEDVQPIGWMDQSLGITAKAVRRLEREWAEARTLIERVQQAEAWLEREPARWPKVIGLVEQAMTCQEREQGGRP